MALQPTTNNRPRMSRLRLLLIAVLACLLVFKVGSLVFGKPGITIRAYGDPLHKVMASVSRQGKVRLLTNQDGDKPITLHLVKAPLMDALTSLAAAADSRLQLRCVLAPGRGRINDALDAFESGDVSGNENWKRFYSPLPTFLMTDRDFPPDPRREKWIPRELEGEPDLHAWLEQAAEATNAAVFVPADWNPEVPKLPKGGAIEKALPRLARAAGGKARDVFFLRAREQRSDGPSANGESADRGSDSGPRPDGRPDWENMTEEEREARRKKMEGRMTERIDKLPGGERDRAKGRMNMFRTMFAGLREMSEEERREKLQEILNLPAVQEEMFKHVAKRTNQTTPEKRKEMYRTFISNGGKLTRPGRGPGGGGRRPGGGPR